ncbi:zinc metalloprotease HtpX [Acidobacteriota bacterium]
MFWYKMRLWFVIVFMFGIVYAIVTMIAHSMGVQSFYFYLILTVGIVLIQYLIGPKIVEWTMKVRYLSRDAAPELHDMIEDLARRAHIPKPRIGVAETELPNAFAFGRWKSDGRVCVTRGILDLLDRDELRAVLGHEIAHLKNRDVMTITLLSVIPLVMYRIAWHLLFFGSMGRRRDSGGHTALIGLAALVFYFITNLGVLYVSRIREYFADKGSVNLGNAPHTLASALYKLVYGNARAPKQALKQVEGLKAFFVNDPSRALREFKDINQLDMDRDGTIDADELASLHGKEVKVKFNDRLMELLSTHPNMLKRIKQLSKHGPWGLRKD